ncbi:MAG: hypothetical protein HC802_09380 [Caldilineaceae bacterium]|nr:hypothetical protein [Caldilineaceae bacterium]
MEDLSFWADISVIWLSLLFFIFAMIPLVIFYFAVRGMNIVNNRAQGFFRRAQSVSRTTRDRTIAVSDRIADPIVRTQGQVTKAETVVQKLVSDDTPPKMKEAKK